MLSVPVLQFLVTTSNNLDRSLVSILQSFPVSLDHLVLVLNVKTTTTSPVALFYRQFIGCFWLQFVMKSVRVFTVTGDLFF